MQPELAVPFAGPPCFLDPELRHFNTSLRPPGIFPDSEQAVEWLREHLPGQAWACFRPGDRIDLATGAVTPDPVSARFSYTDGIDGYLDRYAADRAGAFARVHAAAGAPGPDLGDRFRRHFTRLGTLSPYFLTRIGMTVRFEVTGPHGGSWDVRMDADGLRVDLDGGATAPEYTFTLAGHWLGAVLNGQIAWEDLLLSLRLTARREPDRYNDYLIGLLKHANAPGTGRDRGVRDRAGHRRADRGAGGGAGLRDRPVLSARRRGPRDRCDRRGPDAALPRPQLRVRPGDGGVPQRPEQRRPRTAQPDRERQGQ